MDTRRVEIPLETKKSESLNETQRVLVKARELLGPNGENWVKFPYAEHVCETHLCAGYAVAYAEADGGYWPEDSVAITILHRAAQERGWERVQEYNDDEGTTFQDIDNLFKRAIELACS